MPAIPEPTAAAPTPGPRELLAVLTPGERRRVPWLLLLMTAVAVLEFVGVGGFLPLASLLSDPRRVLSTRWGAALFHASGASDPAGFAIRLGVVLLVLLVLRVALTAYSNYQSFRFSYDVQISISTRILRGLLGRDYEFFLTANSAVLVKNVTQEVLVFTGGVLIPGLLAISQVMILVMVVAVLAWVSPGTALIAGGGIVGSTALLFVAIQRRLTAWGKTREVRLAELSRLAHQALAGVKALKTSGGEELYVQDFRTQGVHYARSNTLYQTAAVAPTMLIELLLFGGAVGLLLVYAAQGKNIATLIPPMTLFGAAAYRILPAARNLFTHVVTLRYNWRSLAIVSDALREAAAAPSGAPAPGRALPPLARGIRLEGVSYRYPTAAEPALHEVWLEIEAGQSVALVGASGAGKTTAADLLLGLLEPTRGRILVDGTPLRRDTWRAWQAQVGYVPQHPFIADASLRANIAFGADPAGVNDAAVLAAVRRASLGALLARLPAGLDTPLGENGVRLSGGERQRVAIARALYREPRVLILDEATSALDTLTEREINEELLASAGELTLVIVAHRLSTVRRCDKLVLMNRGRVEAEGPYEELLRASEQFAAMDRQAGYAVTGGEA